MEITDTNLTIYEPYYGKKPEPRFWENEENSTMTILIKENKIIWNN